MEVDLGELVKRAQRRAGREMLVKYLRLQRALVGKKKNRPISGRESGGTDGDLERLPAIVNRFIQKIKEILSHGRSRHTPTTR